MLGKKYPSAFKEMLYVVRRLMWCQTIFVCNKQIEVASANFALKVTHALRNLIDIMDYAVFDWPHLH